MIRIVSMYSNETVVEKLYFCSTTLLRLSNFCANSDWCRYTFKNGRAIFLAILRENLQILRISMSNDSLDRRRELNNFVFET